MRKPQEIAIDRTLLIFLLHSIQQQEFEMVSDVKLQQMVFLCELQMLGKGLRGFHYDFMRYPYGAFSKDLDNDLLALRRKERLENFDVTPLAEPCVPLLEGVEKDSESNEQVFEILRSVINIYGPQDLGAITKSVEDIELSTVDQPDQKLAIRDISFHAIVLVPARIEVTGELTIPPPTLGKVKTALGM